jgi:glycerate 2-kinase
MMDIQKPRKEFLKHVFNETIKMMEPASRLSQVIKYDGENLSWTDGNLSLSSFDRIWVLGVGKAVVGLAAGLHGLLGSKIHGGLIVCTEVGLMETGPIRQMKGNHPYPDADSVQATESLIEICQEQSENDLIIFLLTGGSSAMLCKPIDGISLEYKQTIHKALLRSGASIHEMNTVRKHLSMVKGGKLLRYFKAKRMLNLIISDVPGDDPSTIGSGPVVADPTTIVDVKNITRKFIPDILLDFDIPETVKPNDAGLPHSQNIWVATPGMNATMAAKNAITMDKTIDKALVLKSAYKGTVVDVCDFMWTQVYNVIDNNPDLDNWTLIHTNSKHPKSILLAFYGESEIKVTGDGKGGRNQHLALLFLKKLVDHPTDSVKNITLLSTGTDGIDGNTTDGGAIIDMQTAFDAIEKNYNLEKYLKTYDSNTFFTKIGDIFSPGPTGNNLMDLQLILIETK